jgi:hypothetical protein
MRTAITLATLLVAAWFYMPRIRHAKWDGKRFNCPINTDLWADESEALAGKDYVYCIPERR